MDQILLLVSEREPAVSDDVTPSYVIKRDVIRWGQSVIVKFFFQQRINRTANAEGLYQANQWNDRQEILLRSWVGGLFNLNGKYSFAYYSPVTVASDVTSRT